MLWPLVLPFKLTAIALASMTLLATAIAAILRRRPARTFTLSTAISLAAFVPVCSLVSGLINKTRFGVFRYESFDQVNDFRVERYLPPPQEDYRR